MEKVIVIGGGGHARVLASVILKAGELELAGYVDARDNGPLLGAPWLGDDSILGALQGSLGHHAALGVGTVATGANREALFDRVSALGFGFPMIVSPDATVNLGVRLGEGTVVFDGATVNTGTDIGPGCILNTSCTVDHDARISGFVHIAPGAVLSGGVSVGARSLVGTGAVIIQGISVCGDAVIGAGSVVVKNIETPGTYAGNPARRIR